MRVDVKEKFEHASNYGGLRKLSDIKYIVIHYTGNDGDTDEGNAVYFQGAQRNASAHYFVDDDSITRTVLDNTVAWHCGGKLYSDVAETGGGKFNGICRNANSIGVEMCDTVKDGTYSLSEATRRNVIKLVADLMDTYEIPIENVIRHFDVTGKYCPAYFCPPRGSNAEWDKFKSEIVEYRQSLIKSTQVVEKKVRRDMTDQETWDALIEAGYSEVAAAGIMGNLYRESGLRADNLQNTGEKKLGMTDIEYTDAVDSGTYIKEMFVRDGHGYGLAQWTYWSRKESLYDYMMGKGVSIGDEVEQFKFLLKELSGYKSVVNTLKEAKTVREASDVIMLKYERPANQSVEMQEKRAAYGKRYYNKFSKQVVKENDVVVKDFTVVEVEPYTVQILVDSLPVMAGPGAGYGIELFIKDKGVYTIVAEYNGWGRLKSGAGWICLNDSIKKLVDEHKKFEPYKVKVTAAKLNYRKGPGTNYLINGVIRDRGIYTIVEEKDGWGKLKSGAGWISLKYTIKK